LELLLLLLELKISGVDLGPGRRGGDLPGGGNQSTGPDKSQWGDHFQETLREVNNQNRRSFLSPKIERE